MQNEIERLKKMAAEFHRMSVHEDNRANEFEQGTMQRAVHYQASIAYAIALDMVNQNLEQVVREMRNAVEHAYN